MSFLDNIYFKTTNQIYAVLQLKMWIASCHVKKHKALDIILEVNFKLFFLIHACHLLLARYYGIPGFAQA